MAGWSREVRGQRQGVRIAGAWRGDLERRGGRRVGISPGPDGRRRHRLRAGGLHHPASGAVRDALVPAQCFGRAHLLRFRVRVPIPPPTAAPWFKEPTRASSLRDDAFALLASRGGVDDFMISLEKGHSQGGLGARSAGKFG